jgi:pyruvate-ferredoxin/flavodoxin oxidoreductase
MATRATGFALLASSSIQEIMDMALISQAATLESRVPFVHFFDGFRSSHEINKVERLTDEVIREMMDDELVFAHRARGLSPDHPVVRGTAQNPDVFFQARETVNPYYDKTPGIVQKAMDQFAKLTGRQYHLFDYYGAEDAERVIVIMTSGADTAVETINHLVKQDEKVGVVQVHLYRPFSVKHFIDALPETVKAIAVLDRTKEPGSSGEPMYKDVVTALNEVSAAGELKMPMPKVIGGRYGLSSKEFTPAMVKGVLDELKKDKPKNHFTVGIHDDLTNTSIDYDPSFNTASQDVVRAMFFGLGSDGTVGANKNSIKIIGNETDNYAQGYFVYDSKKAGSKTTSHLRFGPNPIMSRYLIQSANFVACHQFVFLDQIDVLSSAAQGAVFLLNSTFGADEVWDKLPRKVQEQIIEKDLKFYVIDAYSVANDVGMGGRINTIMQTCFFAISGVLPKDEAIQRIKDAIKKTYGRKGEDIVQKNYQAVDQALAHLHEVEVPAKATSDRKMPPTVSPDAPDFVQTLTAEIMAGRGDDLPVSIFPEDGTYPTATTKWEKRNVALKVPEWDPEICIQCGNCSFVCPHSCIRAKKVKDSELENGPESFKAVALKGKNAPEDEKYALTVAVEDCTGCGQCVDACPAKSKKEEGKKALNMVDKAPILQEARANFAFFDALPTTDRTELNLSTVKDIQYADPLFEFSGACAGCGETPYVKLLSQLFGDRTVIANATGCSSIYGGNLPTTPYAVNKDGRGPAWSNSLFEDNAEFGFGFRLTYDKQFEIACELADALKADIGEELVNELINASQKTETEIAAQRKRVAELKQKLQGTDSPEAKNLLSVADTLVQRSVWILGGDGWAYDIGYGGLDHVLASGRNVNVLVMDTEVYSNTGGQASKATPRGAVAKFAAGGKPQAKKDLGMIAMCYGNIYVAKIALGANPRQAIKAFIEAEAYDGPSLIIAYSHCIAHGINMRNGFEQQKLAVKCGHWPLFRYNPDLDTPLSLDSKAPSIPVKDYAYNEIRYKMLTSSKPEEAERLIALAQTDVEQRWKMYEQWPQAEG